MKSFTVYKANGEIIQSGICSDNDFNLQGNDIGAFVIECLSNPLTDYVENGVIVKKPQKPIGSFVFDYLTKTWIANVEDQKNQIKVKRDSLLLQSDWTQLPNSPLTSEKQSQWANYRQQLRDITLQSGYPYNVIWPVKPE